MEKGTSESHLSTSWNAPILFLAFLSVLVFILLTQSGRGSLLNFASAEPTIAINETYPAATVHAYSQNTYVVTQHKIDTNSNQISVQVYGFVLNPLYNGDPTYDYYVFDVYPAVSSGGSSNGWWADSAGLKSGNGPTFNFTVYGCNSPNEGIIFQSVSPKSQVDEPGNIPQTTSVDLSYSGLSIGISRTFTPPLGQTAPIAQDPCTVGWASASTRNDNPDQSSYQYDPSFALGLKIPKGTPATISIVAEGNFYKRHSCGLFGLLTCYWYAHPKLSFSTSFSPPPLTIISSSPASATGLGYVTVDAHQIQTPAKFVWDEGVTHTITASDYVRGGFGTRYLFNNWSAGGAVQTSNRTINIISPTVPTTFVANFYQQNELNISASSNGSTNPPTGSYWKNGTLNVVVTAIPNTGYELNGWTLDGSDKGKSNPLTVSMNSPHTLVASFVQEPTLTVSAGIGGTVAVQSQAISGGVTQRISAGSSETWTIPSGSSVTLTANPENSFLFGNWTGTQFFTTNQITIIVSSNTQEKANFAIPMATVTFTQAGLGSSATGIVLTLDGSTYGLSSLPLTKEFVVGSHHDFAWSGNLSGGPGTEYLWRSTSGLTTAESGTITVPSGGGSISSSWATRYLVTFQAIGLDNSALGTVLAVGNSRISYSQLPYSIWVDASTSLVYNYTARVPSNVPNVQFMFSSVSSPSPVFINGPLTISASYTRPTATLEGTSTQSTSTVTATTQTASTVTITSLATSSARSTTPTNATPTTSSVAGNQPTTSSDSTILLGVGAAVAVVATAIVGGLLIRRR